MVRIHRWAVLAVSAAMLTSTAACGSGAAIPSGQAGTAPAQVEASVGSDSVGSILQQAEKAGASPQQVAVLKRGTPPFADYRAAVYATLDCMEKAGLQVQPATLDNTQGFPMLNYGFGPSGDLSEEQAKKLGDDCMNVNSLFIEMAYQTSPQVAEVKEKRFAPYRQKMIDCLTAYGVDVDPKATKDELIVASEKERMASGRSCLDELQVPL